MPPLPPLSGSPTRHASSPELGNGLGCADRGAAAALGYRFDDKELTRPGRLAALWSQQLPDARDAIHGVPSPAAASNVLAEVRAHLAEVDLCVKQRQPSELEAALKRAQGTSYLRAAAKVRKTRSATHLHKHAVETALASHLVKARATLGRWHTGVNDIQEACRLRDEASLRGRLDAWAFAEDEPVVRQAREELERWTHIGASLPRRLREGVDRRDVKALKQTMKELREQGPRVDPDVPGMREALALLRSFEAQKKALTLALDGNSARNVREALDTWSFDTEDQVCIRAREVLEVCAKQREDLVLASDAKPPNIMRLRRACEAWGFEPDDADFLRAANLVEEADKVEAELAELLNEKVSPNLLKIREKVDTWPFATGYTAGTSEVLEAAKERLVAFEKEIGDTIEAQDGWSLQRQWDANGKALPLEGTGLASAAVDLLTGRAAAAEDLLQLLSSARSFGADGAAKVQAAVDAWPYAATDPVVLHALSWLRLRESVEARSSATLEAAVASGSAPAVRGALERCQGLATDGPATLAAKQLLERKAKARNVVAALASGKEEILADAEAVDAILQEAMVGDRTLSFAWLLRGGDPEALERCAARAHDYLTVARSNLDALLEHLQETFLGVLLHKVTECHAVLSDMPTTRTASSKVLPKPIVEAAGCVIANVTRWPEAGTMAARRSIVPAVVEALDAMSAALATTATALQFSSAGAPASCVGAPCDLSGCLPAQLRELGLSSEASPLCWRVAEAPLEAGSVVGSWELKAEVPLESTSAASRILGTAPPFGRAVAAAMATFVLIAKSFHEDFLPLCAALGAAGCAVNEAEEAFIVATEALAQAEAVASVNDMLPDEQFELFGLVLPALLAERIDSARSAQIATVLASPPEENAVARLCWAAEILKAAVTPSLDYGESMARLVESLASEELNACLESVVQAQAAAGQDAENVDALSPPVCSALGDAEVEEATVKVGSTTASERSGCRSRIDLFKVVLCALGETCAMDSGYELSSSTLVADAEVFRTALCGWNPCAAAELTPEAFQLARATLMRLWDWFSEEHCDGNHVYCRLYAWASLLLALTPQVSLVRRLAPACESLRAASKPWQAGGPGGSEDAAAKAWTKASKSLERENEEPWWWLTLLGCEAPADFYEKHFYVAPPPPPPPPPEEPAPQDDVETQHEGGHDGVEASSGNEANVDAGGVDDAHARVNDDCGGDIPPEDDEGNAQVIVDEATGDVAAEAAASADTEFADGTNGDGEGDANDVLAEPNDEERL